MRLGSTAFCNKAPFSTPEKRRAVLGGQLSNNSHFPSERHQGWSSSVVRLPNHAKPVRFGGAFTGWLVGAAFNTAKDAVCAAGSAGLIGLGYAAGMMADGGLGLIPPFVDGAGAAAFHKLCKDFMKEVRLT